MNNLNLRKPHIVFYFSDTGGGHRSAAEAIIEAINLEYKDQVTTEMVDFFKDYAPVPFNKAPDMYPYMVKAPRLWREDHSYVPGGSVRSSTQSRYRQWLTHKFGTWHDQFGVSGCTGCGRCIAWCPVGIDVTVELSALLTDPTRDEAAHKEVR